LPWILLVLNLFLMLIFEYTTLLAPLDVEDFVFSYLVIPVFIVLYLRWKLYHKIKFVVPAEADLVTGRRDWLTREPGKGGVVLWERAMDIVER